MKKSFIGFGPLLSMGIFIILILFIVDGLIPQINIAILGDYLLNIQTIPRIVIIIALALLISETKLPRNANILKVLYLFMNYMIALLIFNSLRFDFNYSFQGFMIYLYYYLLIFILPLRFKHSNSYPLVFLSFLAVVLCVIAAAQYLINDPILSTSSANRKFSVISWQFISGSAVHTRAFSLFSSALSLGIFLIYYTGIAFFNILQNKKIKDVFLILIIISGIYFTITRAVYLGFFLAIAGAAAYFYASRKYLLFFPPIISLFLGIMIASSSGSFNFNSQITDVRTLEIRSGAWQDIFDRLYSDGLADLLFGKGIYQTSSLNSATDLLIDNTYLAILLQGGIVGMVFIIIIYASSLNYILSTRKNPVSSAMYALMVALPAMSVFNIVISDFAVYFLLTLILFKMLPQKINIIGDIQ